MTNLQPATFGYALGMLGYLVFAGMLWTRSRQSMRGRALFLAALASMGWELTGLLIALGVTQVSLATYFVFDALRVSTWVFFFLQLLPRLQLPGWSIPLSPWGRIAISFGTAVLLLAVTLPEAPLASAWSWQGRVPASLFFGLFSLASVFGLSLCEQLIRSTLESSRWAVKPLALGVGAIFAFDLFMFSEALLLKDLNPEVWSVRGLIHSFAIPLVMVSSARNRHWTIDVAVSRNIVFGSTALLLSGLYMLAVAGVGYYVRFFGGTWGTAIQATFFFIAFLVLSLLTFSGSVRARIKVFVSKNFFSYRYDYREEWLKFTKLLATPGEDARIVQRSIRALADLVESPAGAQWWRAEDGAFRPTGSWNCPAFNAVEPGDSAFVHFLTKTGWVVEVSDPNSSQSSESEPPVPNWIKDIPSAWLIIPLPENDRLGGFALLMKPRTPVELNWEVLDLLKTAARQAATVLGQVRLAEALAETQQFSAFSRMSAFVVHDLKNLVAQLSLMQKNAVKHGHNPEFQKDMADTIAHVVERMNRLLLQLRSGTTPIANPSPVDTSAIISGIQSAWARQGRSVRVKTSGKLWALAHEDRLERVIGHLVQNAFDAMEGVGTVTVGCWLADSRVIIEVADTGAGMTPEFVRDELFKPFRSTKATGMGVGAYESLQYITELGGQITVDSKVGTGTRIRVSLPAVQREGVDEVSSEAIE